MVNEGYVYISVRGDFDPEEFTAQVGVLPSETWRKGERNASRMIPSVSGWTLSSPRIRGEVIDLYRLADELLDSVTEKISNLREAAHSHGVKICLQMVIYSSVLDSVPTPIIGLSERSIMILSQLGASLDIDSYKTDLPENEK